MTSAYGRRDVLKAAGLGALAVAGTGLGSTQARATPEEVDLLIDNAAKKAPVEGKITLGLPDIAENAATVRTDVSVDHPMDPDNYVQKLYLFGEENPRPNIATFNFTPDMPKAEVATRIRLAKTQNVVALAVTNNGDAFITKKQVKVTIGGCGK